MFLSPRGLGGVSPTALKEVADVRAGPVSITYQRSVESVEVLIGWKPPTIIPIYRKGMKTQETTDFIV